jgi:hypothetical protein
VLDFAAVQVALGLIFVYLVLALVCSALNEAVSTAWRWRARFLREGIANLLDPDDPVKGAEYAKSLYAHPLVNGLIRPNTPKGKPRHPSYLPSRVFATALLDIDRKGAERTVKESIDAVPSPQTRAALQALWADSNGRQDIFRHAVEGWYDDAMQRVSGWYRRRMHLLMWVVAGVIVLALNVDTIRIADHLWKDRTIRAAVIARTQHPAAGETNPSVTNVAVSVDKLQQLKLPIGWWIEERPHGGGNWATLVILKTLGLLMTAAAMTLGAPFWFDLLGKVARVRSAGQIPVSTGTQQPVIWEPAPVTAPRPDVPAPVRPAPRPRRGRAA